MIQCNKCNAQYIGETKLRHLGTDMVSTDAQLEKPSHNNTLINPQPLQITLPSLPILSMDNIELVPLELITLNRDAMICKVREAFLISKVKTLEPSGLNRRDKT